MLYFVKIIIQTSGEYKEKYRADMVRWGEEKRKSDSAYFVRLSFGQLEKDAP